MRRGRFMPLVAALVVCGATGVRADQPVGAVAGAPAKVSVDFSISNGELLHTERFNNFGNVRVFPEQRAEDVAFFNQQGLHGSVYRVWLSSVNARDEDLFNRCDLATNTCDLSPVDAYLTEASTVSDAVLVNLNPMDFVEGSRPIRELQPLLELILRSVKAKYPRVQFVEAFNEPDHQFNGSRRNDPVLQPDGLYRFYVPFYNAVNAVNAALEPEQQIKLGGPAFTGFNETWIGAFLDGYASDPDAQKRLDYLSYHGYGYFDDNWSFHNFKDDPSQIATQRPRLDAMLASRSLRTDLPAFITESGPYPGPLFDEPTGRTDYLRQASGSAAIQYWYANQHDTYPFNWCVRHNKEERKDQLVTRLVPGAPVGLVAAVSPVDVPEPDVDPPGALIPAPTFTPYGNFLVMGSKMKKIRVAATSDALTAGRGVYAVGSKDVSGAAVMVWNYQGPSATSFTATLDLSNLPPQLRGREVRERVFRIDDTTSNFFTNPAAPELQQVSERTFMAGRSLSETLDLGPNALYLVVLEPASAR